MMTNEELDLAIKTTHAIINGMSALEDHRNILKDHLAKLLQAQANRALATPVEPVAVVPVEA